MAKRWGYSALLDDFFARHGESSCQVLNAALETQGVCGDLAALACAYLGASDEGQREVREFNAWLHGTKIARARARSIARGSLDAKSAKKSLSELTHLVRALGFNGCLFCFCFGHVIAKRTQRQREKAYIVLRELVDNFDSGRGLVGTRLVVSGGALLFEGPRSVRAQRQENFPGPKFEPLLSTPGDG